MEERNLRKVMVGTVTSDKMDKTVVVAVEDSVRHNVYGKTVKRTYKLKAHDEANNCKDKRWRVVEILDKKGGE